LSLVPKGLLYHHFHSSNAASAVKTLCFFKKIHCRCQSETASALGTKPLSTPAMMVINPKPDPPVVTILDSNPGLVV
jgi:hypothetical protein